MKSLVIFILALSSVNSYAQTISARGTGRTTGHIATLSISNPSAEAIAVFIPPNGKIDGIAANGTALFENNENRGTYYYIPSSGRYQSYVAESVSPPPGASAGTISIPPGDTLHVPIKGYCANIHSPPVPNGSNMPPVSSWRGGNGKIPGPNSGIPLGFAPSKKPEKLPFVASNVSNQLPGKPLVTSFDKNPEAVEYLFHALDQISVTYDSLATKGAIATPFSGDDAKERESVIQQTFWIYSSSITGEPYTKPQFHDRMVVQYEENTGTDIEKAPVEVVEKIDEGVDDFWSTFTAVGLEAKVISTNPEFPNKDDLEDSFGNSDLTGVRAHTDSAASKAATATGADAVAIGAGVATGSTTDKSAVSEEVAHSEQPNSSGNTIADGVKAGAAGGVASGTTAKQPGHSEAPPPEKSASCSCGEITAQFSFSGILQGRKPQTVSGDTKSQKPVAVNFDVTREDLMRSNFVQLSIDDIELSCDCEGAPCPVIPIPDSLFDTFAAAPATGQEAEKTEEISDGVSARAEGTQEIAIQTYKYKVEVLNSSLQLVDDQDAKKQTDGSVELNFQRPRPNRPNSKRTMKVKIEASCASESCFEAKCQAIFEVNLNIR